MTINIFSNNAKTTLASSITSSQTSITVAPGTGSKFPSPSAGVSTFKVTFVSAADASVYEICNCTARSGDVLTVVRAQEGTTGTPFVLNDIVGHFDTAGVMTDLVQSEQLQQGYYQYADATGTVNAITAQVASNLTSVESGFKLWLNSSGANTGASTLVLTLGSTILPSYPIVKGNNQPLTAGDIPSAGYQMALSFSTAYGAYILINPSQMAGFASSLTDSGYQKLPTGFIMQWGTSSVISAGGTTTVTFPIAFPTAVFGYPQCTIGSEPGGNTDVSMFVPRSVTTSGFVILNPDVDSSAAAKWFAIGY